MEIEVLVAAMNQSDLSLYDKMNLKCNAVIANQCGKWDYCESEKVRMISSATKGVGINRNIALECSKADILLFADDDIVYYDGELKGVLEAFEKLPRADVIFFGMDMVRGGEIYKKHRRRTKRLHIWNSLNYGTCFMAVRKSSVQKNSLCFTELFGGGAIYSCGEDSLFIRDALSCGLKVYSYDYVLGKCIRDESSWFKGYDEKFLFDKGAWVAAAFPRMKHLMKLYFSKSAANRAQCSYSKALKYVNKGIKAYRSLGVYTEEGV